MTRATRRVIIGALLIVLGAGRGGASPAAGRSAREILDQAKQLEETRWTDRSETLTLVTHHNSRETLRKLRTHTLRPASAGTKTLSFLIAPPELTGVGFLQWSRRGGDDEQWLYTPKTSQDPRRISSRAQDESFIGSAFTYRDLGILGKIAEWTEGEAPSSLIGDASLSGVSCWVIDLRPTQSPGYRRLRLWMESDRLVPRRIEFYGPTDEHVKTLVLDEWIDVRGIPTPQRLEMQRLFDDTRTVVTVADVSYDTGLSDDFFTERHLVRGDLPDD
jgi:hypothetical protein